MQNEGEATFPNRQTQMWVYMTTTMTTMLQQYSLPHPKV